MAYKYGFTALKFLQRSNTGSIDHDVTIFVNQDIDDNAVRFRALIISDKLIKLRRKRCRMRKAIEGYAVFEHSIQDYHRSDDIDTPIDNPYPNGGFENLLYAKSWIDTVQWHLEDLIRIPSIDPKEGMLIKRRIDKSNQDRTDLVEKIDDFFLDQFKAVIVLPGTRINSETPAWLLDRMSILSLKIYHMREQTERKDAGADHVAKCRLKLNILWEQRSDMMTAFDEMMDDIGSGRRRFKVYRQLKMYNDASLNPMLYGSKN